MRKHYLVVSDFDQTLSFNDSGLALSEMLGIPDFHDKVGALSLQNLVQQGAELTYLLRHDPEFRYVRSSDLVEVGRRIRLKRNVALLADFLKNGIDGFRFDFYIVSAAPWEVVHSDTVMQVAAGYGKVAAVDDLRIRLDVNRGEGLTIAASEARHISQIARRTVISDDALSVLIPVLEEIAGYDHSAIRLLFEKQGLLIQEWDSVRTDWLTIRGGPSLAGAA